MTSTILQPKADCDSCRFGAVRRFTQSEMELDLHTKRAARHDTVGRAVLVNNTQDTTDKPVPKRSILMCAVQRFVRAWYFILFAKDFRRRRGGSAPARERMA